MIDLEEKLSEHFTLREMIRTSHRSIKNIPNEEIIENLKKLCVLFLEPIRFQFGPVIITSGYRCKALNKAAGSKAKDSAHIYGCAADFITPNENLDTVFDWVVNSSMDYDQIINENSYSEHWLHIGMLRPNHEKEPRKNALIFQNGEYFKA